MQPRTIREVATRLLALTEGGRNYPPAKIALFYWRGQTYYGQTQQCYSEQPEILMVSKTGRAIPPVLETEIRRQRRKIPMYQVAEVIDFTDNYHLLRLQGNQLDVLSPEQTLYAQTHAFQMRDQAGNVIEGPQNHIYPNPEAH